MPLVSLPSSAPLCKSSFPYLCGFFLFLHIPPFATRRERHFLLSLSFIVVSPTDTYASRASLCIHLFFCSNSCSISIEPCLLSFSSANNPMAVCQSLNFSYSHNVSFLGRGGELVVVWLLFGDIPPMLILEYENLSLEQSTSLVTEMSVLL